MSLEECKARIDARDGEVRGWSYLDWNASGGRGPLAGLVAGIKDVIDVSGMPTTHGSPIFADTIAKGDAEAVARLRSAGAVILGKTVTAEFATYHPGRTVNPRKPGHTPGGSSSGSAAVVADGQADFALGTQTAGSVIRPACFCGTLGLKPTFGRYPLAGVLATATSLDTLGIFARNLAVLRAADAVLAADPATPAPRQHLTLGVCETPAWTMASEQMRDAFHGYAKRLSAAGISTVELILPEPFAGLGAAQALIHRYEVARELGWIRHQFPDQVSEEFRTMVDMGAAETDSDYSAARHLQRQCRGLLEEVFAPVDLIIAPGAPGAAPEGLQTTGDPVFQRVWTAVGAPCLGFPVEWHDGLPLGVQVVALPGTDGQMLADAETLLAQAELRSM